MPEFYNKYKNIIKALAFIFAVILIVVIFLTRFYSPLLVVGNSMNPSLANDDLVLVDKHYYKKHDILRYDIVVFKEKTDASTNLIKRVIGLPGETLQIKDDKVYVDGSKLDDYYGIFDSSVEKTLEVISDYGPITLGEDEYFVLGDNRYHSSDSRMKDIGFITKDDIFGRLTFRLLPLKATGSLMNQ